MALGKLIADPFLVQVLDTVDFADDVLGRIFAIPADWDTRATGSNRWYEYGDSSWVVLDNLRKHRTNGTKAHPKQDYFIGSVCRAHTEELPMQIGSKGVEPLGIDEDDGLVEHLAFLWDPVGKLIWLQRERNVGRVALMQYLRQKSGNSVGITPIFEDDAPAQAKKVKDVKKIEFNYVVAKQGRKPKGFFSFISSLQEYGAATIEVTVKPERGEFLGDGARAAVREVADAVREGGGEVSKAKVWGDIDDDHRDVFIDLFRQRSDFSTAIPRQKSRDADRLMNAVKNIWLSHRADVTV